MTSVCRVCLAGNTRLRSLENNLLINVFEKLSNTQFNSEDARPRVLCYICYRKLLRCHTFSQMACRSEKMFNNLFRKGLEPIHHHITEADRRMKQLLSTATVQFATSDSNATNAVSPVTIKDEPISSYDIEEMTAEQNKLIEVPEKCTKIQSRLEKNQSDQWNQETVKDEPIPSVKTEEMTTEMNKLVEVEYVPEDCSKSKKKDVVIKKLINIQVQPMKRDVLKKQFCCNKCNKIFSKKSKIISHIRSSHLQHKEKQYSLVRKYTKNAGTNKDTVIHWQKRMFVCNMCDNQFNYKCHLDEHMSIHTGEKPFPCNACNKQFRYKANLINHMKIHRDEKPFASNVCEKSFACNICDKHFSLKGKLMTHMRIHTEEKPFACKVCDRKFCYKSGQIRHQRSCLLKHSS